MIHEGSIYRYGTPDWNDRHQQVLDMLTRKFGIILNENNGLMVGQLNRLLRKQNPRLYDLATDSFVTLLYAKRKPLYVEQGVLKSEFKGIVYTPRIQVKDGKLLLELAPLCT